MATEYGIVENVDDTWAWVKTRRSGACAHCGNKSHCEIVAGSDQMVVKAENRVRAGIGDEVELYLDSKTRYKCIFMIYVLPVFGLMIGAFAADSLSRLLGISVKLGMPLFSLTGLALAYLLMRRFAGRLAARNALNPVVHRVRRRAAAGVACPHCS